MPTGTAFRVYQLAIGDESKGYDNQPTEHSKDDNNMSYFTDMQFSCSVNYTSDKSKTSTDDTSFDIYNLNPDSRAKFLVEGATVMLRAGYDDNFERDAAGDVVPNYETLPIIYLGSVSYAVTQKRGVDMVTKVFCSNDKIERLTTMTSTTYAQGTKRSAVITDLVKQLNLAILEIDTSTIKDAVYEGGISVYGRVADELTRICEENGLMWYTHNKQVRVTPLAAAPKTLAWEIRPFQVIDSVEGYYKRTQTKIKPKKASAHPRGAKKKTEPAPLPENTTVTTKDGIKTKVRKGVRCKVHLDGRLKLGDNVKLIDTGDFDGQYKIISIQHSLNFRGGEWSTELDLVSTEA
ncbi:baseplate hub protein [Yersinia phage vB_YenM_P778]